MILPIYCVNQPVLRQKCAPVQEFGRSLSDLVDNMRETMVHAEGIGLAAPQIGLASDLIVLEYEAEDNRGFPFIAIANPRITWKSPYSVVMVEGCLSIPGIEAPVRRPSKVRVKGLDVEGNELQITASGLFSRVLQHEIDHLSGVLFTDYVKEKQLNKKPIPDYPRIV
jgi:peptide deformylase